MTTGAGSLAVVALVAVGIPGVGAGLAVLLDRRHGNPPGGHDEVGAAAAFGLGPIRMRRTPAFLAVLLIGVVAVGLLFLVPWAAAVGGLDHGAALAEMALFVGLLGVGLLWAWRRGSLGGE